MRFNQIFSAMRNLIVLSWVCLLSCDGSTIIGDRKPPTSAHFQEAGSACQVVVTYPTTVNGLAQSRKDFYRLESGAQATSVQSIPEVVGVLVSFPELVSEFDMILAGEGTDLETHLPVVKFPSDDTTATLLDVRYVADAQNGTVMLTYDDAVDPTAALDVTNYSIANTLDHPASAEVVGCGMQVALHFDSIAAGASIDIVSQTDINGIPIGNVVSIPVERSDDRTRPEPVTAIYPADGDMAYVDVYFSEAVDATTGESPNNYTIVGTGESPVSARAIGGSMVRLTFASIDPPGSINVTGVKDMAGNDMSDAVTLTIQFTEDDSLPTVVSASPADREGQQVLRVYFSEAITRTSAEHLATYLMTEPDSSLQTFPTLALVAEGGHAVDLVYDYLPDGASISVSGLIDLNGNAQGDTQTLEIDFTDTTVPLGVAGATFVPDAEFPAVDVAFNRPVNTSTAQHAGNYAFSNNEATTLALVQEDGRTVRVLVGTLAITDSLVINGVLDSFGVPMSTIVGQVISASDEDKNRPSADESTFVGDQETPTVHIEFSEAIDRDTAEKTTNFRLMRTGNGAESATVLNGGRVVELTFGPLALDDTILVSNVVDLSGNPLESSEVIIATAGDITAPSIESAMFLANQQQPTIEFEFSEAINRTLAESPGLYSLNSDDIFASEATVQSDGRTVRAVFPGAEADSTVTVHSVNDFGGNAMASYEDISVGSANDDDPPVATSVVFKADTDTPTVVVTFSEAVDRDSAEREANYGILNSTRVPDNAVLQDDSHTVHVEFRNLAIGELLVIDDIEDFAGNIAATTSYGIGTTTDTTAPTVVSAKTSGTKKILVTFSEAVDRTTAETLGSYVIKQSGTTLSSVTVESDGYVVGLSTTGAAVTSGMKIDVSGVKDLHGNTMTAQVDFTVN